MEEEARSKAGELPTILRGQEAPWSEEPLALSAAGPFSHAAVVRSAGKEAALQQLREDVEGLAMEVSQIANEQIERCKSLRELRATAKAFRLRQSARLATEVQRNLKAECMQRAEEANEVSEAAAALRARAKELRQEISATHSEAATVAATRPAQTASRAAVEQLVAELWDQERRTNHERLEEAKQEELQARLLRQNAELAEKLASTQLTARQHAGAIQDLELVSQEVDRKMKEVLNRIAAAKEQVKTGAMTRSFLEAELKQQLEATSAWRVCAQGLLQEAEDVGSPPATPSRSPASGEPLAFSEARSSFPQGLGAQLRGLASHCHLTQLYKASPRGSEQLAEAPGEGLAWTLSSRGARVGWQVASPRMGRPCPSTGFSLHL